MQELVDFDYLNRDKDIRLTISAVNVGTGDLTHFDSHSGNLCATTSVPAGAYRQHSLVWHRRRTLLGWWPVLQHPAGAGTRELPKGDTLCFMVDLWSADGAEPDNIEAVRTRLKDVTYASRCATS
jgi:NTE family protein